MQALVVLPGTPPVIDIRLVPSPLSDSSTLPASMRSPEFVVVARYAA